ncbi:CpcT/CpeT family chromophore lyase [Calothrix sp. UHCC 0171]|uniref:CpcT/CpeT family chromophore lyase n=1 Tax=Calothrix sp. UHCC 0171 TaxID=3110245 RepID=UPI002B218225|nr:CpcT/CpeT family chromophore lyase [Calothrix sp. UHCC 0171]MEA5570741.1 CpcT/CpeT family chromophore lyase [Calothrix sp. UHCC 0171]
MTISFNNHGTNTNTSDLIVLTQWMAGDCSNQKQAFVNPTQYAHIHIFSRLLPFEFSSGIGFYSCLIPRNGCQTHFVSELQLTENTWSSLSKGMDIETHEQVYCSTAEPLFFEKKQSFADEISVSNVGETLC